ncbi:hypothetical protein HRbin02_01195 [Candidatus Calditenuaceae archaeon HR02]|nr:hypothetical protein HRbin02_01195 [Candidatus Calditenuaceae archaeon HR02]
MDDFTMPDPSSRRIPADYLDRLLPTIEDLLAPEAPAVQPTNKPADRARQRRRKVHFYIDPEDYDLLESVVLRLAEMQGPLGDPRGLYSKVLRMSVKIGIRELVARVGRGG